MYSSKIGGRSGKSSSCLIDANMLQMNKCRQCKDEHIQGIWMKDSGVWETLICWCSGGACQSSGNWSGSWESKENNFLSENLQPISASLKEILAFRRSMLQGGANYHRLHIFNSFSLNYQFVPWQTKAMQKVDGFTGEWTATRRIKGGKIDWSPGCKAVLQSAVFTGSCKLSRADYQLYLN